MDVCKEKMLSLVTFYITVAILCNKINAYTNEFVHIKVHVPQTDGPYISARYHEVVYESEPAPIRLTRHRYVHHYHSRRKRPAKLIKHTEEHHVHYDNENFNKIFKNLIHEPPEHAPKSIETYVVQHDEHLLHNTKPHVETIKIIEEKEKPQYASVFDPTADTVEAFKNKLPNYHDDYHNPYEYHGHLDDAIKNSHESYVSYYQPHEETYKYSESQKQHTTYPTHSSSFYKTPASVQYEYPSKLFSAETKPSTHSSIISYVTPTTAYRYRKPTKDEYNYFKVPQTKHYYTKHTSGAAPSIFEANDENWVTDRLTSKKKQIDAKIASPDLYKSVASGTHIDWPPISDGYSAAETYSGIDSYSAKHKQGVESDGHRYAVRRKFRG